jgi:hypothetical protein
VPLESLEPDALQAAVCALARWSEGPAAAAPPAPPDAR